MADLDDLGYQSIADDSVDEGLERLRQIRLDRRTPVKSIKTTTTRKPLKTAAFSAEQAAAILKLLGEKE